MANPLVEVDGEGRIVSVELLEDGEIDRRAGVEFYSGIMVAGFVNAHTHLELSYLLGSIEEGSGFGGFASRIGVVRNLFSDEQRERAIRRANFEMEREGVAGVGDICNGSTTFDVKSESTIIYRNFAEVFGLAARDTSAVDEVAKQEMTSLTPHSLYSLNDKLFRSISEQGREPLSIHFMESPVESELYRGEGALHAWYESNNYKYDFTHYESPTQRLIASTPRDRRVILVHNCCITQSDIDAIIEHFTEPPYWVVCPRSNSYISGLEPPLDLMRRNGLNICVGTDSLASNWSLSMLEELRAMPKVPLAERLDWATRQGARALKMATLGEIEVGKTPKINILSGIDYSTMELTETSRISRII